MEEQVCACCKHQSKSKVYMLSIYKAHLAVMPMQEQKDFQADKSLKISARSGQGLEELKEALEEILREDKQLLEGIFPYDQGGQLTVIRKYGELLEEEYREQGIYVKAFVPAELYRNLEKNMKTQEAEIQAGEQP